MANRNPLSLLRIALVAAWMGGILLIGWNCLRLRHSIETADQVAQRAALQRASHTVKNAVDDYLNALQGIVGLYVVSDFKVPLSVMNKYASSVGQFSTYQGALGFGFVRRVPKDQQEAFIRERKRDLPNFHIFSVQSGEPAAGDELFVIESIQATGPRPVTAFGLNVGSETSRRRAAEEAMIEGRAVITPPIQLMQIRNREPGFLMFMPVYRSGFVPKDRHQRKEELVGWAYVSILMNSLMETVGSRIDDKLWLTISDETHDGKRLRLYESQMQLKSTEPISWMKTSIEVGGRSWVMRGSFPPESMWSWAHLFPFAVFLLFSGAYSAGLFLLFRASESRFRSEERVQQMQTWLSALVEGSTYAIVSTRRDGPITTFNRAAEKMLGYRPSDLIDRETPSLFQDASELQARMGGLEKALGRPLQNNFEDLARAMELASEYKEWTLVRRDGSKFPVRLSVTSIRDAEDQLVGFLGVAEDITEEMRLRETIEMQRMQMVATSKMSSLGEMAAGIAHEINNPLAVIMGKSDLVLMRMNEGRMNPDYLREELSKISATALRIATIVKGLRSFARNSDQDPMSEVDVRQIIDETLELCRERFRSEFVEVSVEAGEGLKVLCRPAQISQVLMNLLNNAFDAVKDAEEKSVRIAAKRVGGNIEISVTDSGPGVPAHLEDRIMEPFFTTKETGSGTGLGLSIAAGVMKSHRGDLWLDQSHSETRFVISLKAV